MTSNNLKESQQMEEPKDKYWVVYYLIFLLGLVHTLPWTFFATASDYWMYKFRNTSLGEAYDPNHKTVLQVEFSPCVTISLQLSTVTFYLLGLFFAHKFSLKFKLFGALSVMLAAFVVVAIFVLIDTDSWQTIFFAITMVAVAVINAMSAILNLTVMGSLGNFPKMYLGAYLVGLGVSTIFTSVLQIFALAVGISTKGSALVYFWVSAAVIAIVLGLLILVTTRNKFFQLHTTNQNKTEKNKMMSLQRIVHILKKVWPGGAMMIFWVLSVASVNPCITILVVSENAGTSEWNDKYFTPVITFFMTSIADCLGRVISLKLKLDIKAIYFVLLSAGRVLVFVPLLMLCNAQPRNHLPVVFDHDYQYILILLFYGLSTGYVASMVSYIIPQLVPPEELEDGLQVNAVVVSIFVGVLSFLPFVSVDLI